MNSIVSMLWDYLESLLSSDLLPSLPSFLRESQTRLRPFTKPPLGNMRAGGWRAPWGKSCASSPRPWWNLWSLPHKRHQTSWVAWETRSDQMFGRTSHRSGAMGTTNVSDEILDEEEGGDVDLPPATSEGTHLLLSCSSQEQNHFLVK